MLGYTYFLLNQLFKLIFFQNLDLSINNKRANLLFLNVILQCVEGLYFMGCSFDNFSTSLWDRSYVITLLILAWFIPLVIIFISHIGILYRVRHSNIKDMLIKKLSCALNSNGAHRRTLREAMLCSRDSRSDSIDRDDLPHVIKRVSIDF